jgi:ATP-dependent helicase/nuclease subunit B
MLTLLSISNLQDQRAVFSKFDPNASTWLVSDLKSKLDLNRRLLQDRQFIPGESVLRASELWRTLLVRLRPDLQLVSREFAITLIAQKLPATELDWAQAPGAPQAAFNYLSQFMPILSHPNGEEMMAEWLKANPESEARWGRWFTLSLKLWRELLDDGFIAPAWAAGVLVNEQSLQDVWSRNLFVDLGAELDQVEADLFVHLSEFIDIEILRPQPSWADEYKKTLVAYEIFDRKLKTKTLKVSELGENRRVAKTTYRKYTTMIAEVKDAVAQTRAWLDAGEIRPQEIAIVAPDIEVYWPALANYLEQEGIPCQKDQVRKLHVYPDIAKWLGTLRLRTGSFAEADIEIGLFNPVGNTDQLIAYDRFKVLYSSLYDRFDLDREGSVAKLFSIELESDGMASRDDFVAWGLKQLPSDANLDRFESLYKKLFAECPQSMSLSVRRWLAYLEQLASKTECKVEKGERDGISCIGLSSAENSSAKKMIILGLTETALRTSRGTAILFSDIESLAREFGFFLASDDQMRLEFEARWVTEQTDRELVLSVPETDFGGSPQAASWLWVRGAREAGVHGELTIPSANRWDELQRADIETIARERGWTASHAVVLEKSLHEDLGEVAIPSFAKDTLKAISPSGIEDYLKCPFIFAAKRVFSLSDVAELELEVDPAARGSLMHKVFEMLTAEPIRFEYSEDELIKLVEDARELSGLELADERLWQPLRTRHIDLARRFLIFEKENRDQFKEAKTVGREIEIKGHLDPLTGDLTAEAGEGSFKFQGRIDRIDADAAGNLAIYDYKSSAGSVGQFGSWIKNNRIQLLLYSIAVENGLTSLGPSTVHAAFYYVARPLSRDFGFKVEGVEQGLYDIPDKRKKNRIAPEAKETLFNEGRELVKRAVSGIISGDFAPNPRDRDDCSSCQWSLVCRASHLNT